MKSSYTRKEVADITGIPDRRVLFYTEQPGLLPGIQRAVGRGNAREYTLKSIFYLLLINELGELGVSLSIARHVVNFLDVGSMKNSPVSWSMNLWNPDGSFTDIPHVLIIAPEKGEQTVTISPVVGQTDVIVRADHPSKLVVNLNLVMAKASF